MQTDKSLEYNRPDITVVDKQTKKCLLIDLSYPFDTRIERMEKYKCINCNELKCKIARIWKVKEVSVGASGNWGIRDSNKKFQEVD